MKLYLCSLCLVVSLIGLNACNKSSDPTPTSPIIGRWELNRGLLSGFSDATLNGVGLDLYYMENYASTIDVYSDQTFNANFKQVTVGDFGGTWEFANNSLTLKYDDGDQETYTYAKTKNIEEISATPQSYTLPVSATAVAVGKLQPVYRK